MYLSSTTARHRPLTLLLDTSWMTSLYIKLSRATQTARYRDETARRTPALRTKHDDTTSNTREEVDVEIVGVGHLVDDLLLHGGAQRHLVQNLAVPTAQCMAALNDISEVRRWVSGARYNGFRMILFRISRYPKDNAVQSKTVREQAC